MQGFPCHPPSTPARPVAQTFLRPVGSKRRKASSEGKLRPSKVWLEFLSAAPAINNYFKCVFKKSTNG